MVINDKKYRLSEKHYIASETIKKQIVLGNTFNSKMGHFQKWTHRLNGSYDKTAAFSIDVNGNVYKHFEPIYTSNFLGNIELDKKTITILLENSGWVVKNEEKNQFIDWIGHIYNKPELVVEKKWRDQSYWTPYTEKQLNSTIKLVNMLCDEFSIKKYVIPHNTKIEDVSNFEGVLYRSNLEKYYTDLSPAWNFEKFKHKVENI